MSSEVILYRPDQLGDTRQFEIGEVYYIKDVLLSIPDADRTTVGRKIHDGRMVAIIHNNYLNYDPTWPLIHIAPLSHRVDLMRETDIEILKSDCPWLKYESSMVRLALAQPVLKVDLEKKLGQINEEKIYEILALQQDMVLGKLEPLEE